MDSTMKTLDEVVFDKIEQLGSVTVARGERFEKNLARAIDVANVNQRDIREAVQRLVAVGRLERAELDAQYPDDEQAGVTRPSGGPPSVVFRPM